MKNLFQTSSTCNNPRFIFLETIKSNFENDKLDLLNNIHNELMKSMEQGIDDPKKQLAKAQKTYSEQYSKEAKIYRKEHEVTEKDVDELLENLKNNPSSGKLPSRKMARAFLSTMNPSQLPHSLFRENPSFIAPQKADSWFKLIKNSNNINSAKLTVKNSEEKPDIWNLLQTNENIQKVANYLEKKFGTLRKTDAVGIWFDEKAQKTMIYFKRNGKTTTIPFQEIK